MADIVICTITYVTWNLFFSSLPRDFSPLKGNLCTHLVIAHGPLFRGFCIIGTLAQSTEEKKWHLGQWNCSRFLPAKQAVARNPTSKQTKARKHPSMRTSRNPKRKAEPHRKAGLSFLAQAKLWAHHGKEENHCKTEEKQGPQQSSAQMPQESSPGLCVPLRHSLDHSPACRSRIWVEWAKVGTARTPKLPGKSYSEGNPGTRRDQVVEETTGSEIQTSHFFQYHLFIFCVIKMQRKNPGEATWVGFGWGLESHLYPRSICLVDRLLLLISFFLKT